MKTAKRLITLQYNYYKELEQKLENYAQEGLLLQKIGGLFWTFTKAQPQNRKYTVTYFKEGSIFNPDHTENQCTYIDYAAAAGWEFVCESGQMQIFSTTQENPVPFETDPQEMLDNIHACMKKSLLLSQIVMLLIWLLNIAIRVPSIFTRPTAFLASSTDLTVLVLMCMSALFSLYTIGNYMNWYRKSKKSIEMGGDIVVPRAKVQKIGETIYLVFLFAVVFYLFALLFSSVHWGIVAISVLQIPLFGGVFWGVIKLLKHYKVSAKTNKMITGLLYLGTIVLYIAFVFVMISTFRFEAPTEKQYRTVEWSFANGDTNTYRLYNDVLPLTCQDIYGEIDFPDYSYEANTEKTVLLQKQTYEQSVPPTKSNPPEIAYTVYQSPYVWVRALVLNELLTADAIFDYYPEPLDNALFHTEQAYTFYYVDGENRNYRGEYVLVYADSILFLDTDALLTDAQIAVVCEKLSLA